MDDKQKKLDKKVAKGKNLDKLKTEQEKLKVEHSKLDEKQNKLDDKRKKLMKK